jgi:hypothetical protein
MAVVIHLTRQYNSGRKLMKKITLARIASIILIIHGLVEIAGLFGLITTAQTAAQSFEIFGGMNRTQIASNIVIVILLGTIWGITRWIAALGIWSSRKWAVCLGSIICAVTLISSISIIPTGLMDTIFSAPTLILLLLFWFGNEKVE